MATSKEVSELLLNLQSDISETHDVVNSINDEVTDLKGDVTDLNKSNAVEQETIKKELSFLKEGFTDIVSRLSSIEILLKEFKPKTTTRKKTPAVVKETKTPTPYKSHASFFKGELAKELLNDTGEKKFTNIIGDFTVPDSDEKILPFVRQKYKEKIEGKTEGLVRTTEIAKHVWSTFSKPQKDTFKSHFVEYQKSLETPSDDS
jgi:hypothetical protein